MKSAFYMLANAVWMCLLLPLVFLGMLFTWNTDFGIWVARALWSPFLVYRVAGSTLTVEGGEHVDHSRPMVYVSNHQSTLDIPALFIAIPVNFRYVAKKELRLVPGLGWYLWLGGHIFVDRKSRHRAMESLQAAGKKIRDGRNILVYVEGTRSADGRILPFKRGTFALAIEAGVPVCPVAIEGTRKIMPKNRWSVTPGHIRVKIGAPIDVKPYVERGRDALMRDVRDAVIRLHQEIGGPGALPQNDAGAAA